MRSLSFIDASGSKIIFNVRPAVHRDDYGKLAEKLAKSFTIYFRHYRVEPMRDGTYVKYGNIDFKDALQQLRSQFDEAQQMIDSYVKTNTMPKNDKGQLLCIEIERLNAAIIIRNYLQKQLHCVQDPGYRYSQTSFIGSRECATPGQRKLLTYIQDHWFTIERYTELANLPGVVVLPKPDGVCKGVAHFNAEEQQIYSNLLMIDLLSKS